MYEILCITQHSINTIFKVYLNHRRYDKLPARFPGTCVRRVNIVVCTLEKKIEQGKSSDIYTLAKDNATTFREILFASTFSNNQLNNEAFSICHLWVGFRRVFRPIDTRNERGYYE